MGDEACIDKTIAIIEGFLKKGMMCFSPHEKMNCEVIAELGFRIQSGVIVSDENIAKLAELDKLIDELEGKTEVYLDQLEMFISTNNFESEITNEIFNLKSLIADCLTDPGEEAVAHFREEYEQSQPLMLAYHLWSILRQKYGNPLVVEANEVDRQVTVKKWEDILHAVLGELLFIEAFACGLINKKDMYNCDRLIDKANAFFNAETEEEEENGEEVDELPDEESYWNNLKSVFEKYISEQTHLSNSEKAQQIASQLETIHTEYSFYVFVFNECKLNENVNFYCPNSDAQIIAVWNTGKCNAIIYRSRNANSKNESDFKKLQNELDNCKRGKLKYTGPSLENIIKNQLVDKNILRNYGFICIVDTKLNLAVASAKCNSNKQGPGGNATVEIRRGLLLLVTIDTYFLYAAFD